jgi:hypothetical protein
MDDSNPVASYLQQFFGDEEDDAAAVAALTAQLADQPALARGLRDAWQAMNANAADEDVRALVEEFANRDVGGSVERARRWLEATYAALEPLWLRL